MFAAITAGGAIATYAHANVRADPPGWYAFFFTTIRHHSLHHSTDYESTRCNYANSLIVLDRIFGTYREGEAVVVGQDERKRLSIWEQTMFPVQPLIDKFGVRKEIPALRDEDVANSVTEADAPVRDPVGGAATA